MVLGWRRAFCTSIQKDSNNKDKDKDNSDRTASRLGGFFSNPSTPRLQSDQPPPSSPNLRCRTTHTVTRSTPHSPGYQCKTRGSTRLFHRSAPSSPRSPSTFSLLKSGLRFSKSRCGICAQSVKTGQGTAIFTAECGHSFHFPCISAHVKTQVSLTCPNCNFAWKEINLLNADDHPHGPANITDAHLRDGRNRCVLKVYNDDEPLSSPTSGARFNPIPESDETEEDNDDFPGFFSSNSIAVYGDRLEVTLLPEAAVVSVGKTSEIYAVVLKLKAPAAPVRGAPIDLVTVFNVSRSLTAEKLHLLRKMMRMVVSSLTAADRLSIVAFSTTSKRLLALRRMTTAGRRSARRIFDAVAPLDGGASGATDALMKAMKVIEDRREKNPTASILLFSDGHRNGPLVSSTRFSHLEIPLHTVNLSACLKSPPADDSFANCITDLLNVAVQDLKIQLGFASGSAPAEISAVYSYAGRPAYVGSGSNPFRVGDFHSEEEKELLIELKVPSTIGGPRRILSVRSYYKDPSTQKTIQDKDRPLLIPRPRAVGSSSRDIQRVRCLFITTRAVAESRLMTERNDVDGAHHILASARALVLQSGSGEEFVRGLEHELAELNWKRQNGMLPQRRSSRSSEAPAATEKAADPLTPTSAWRAAERLAKVAKMRKSLNRVSDLHGFEDARF